MNGPAQQLDMLASGHCMQWSVVYFAELIFTPQGRLRLTRRVPVSKMDQLLPVAQAALLWNANTLRWELQLMWNEDCDKQAWGFSPRSVRWSFVSFASLRLLPSLDLNHHLPLSSITAWKPESSSSTSFAFTITSCLFCTLVSCLCCLADCTAALS